MIMPAASRSRCADILQGRAAPQLQGFSQQPHPPGTILGAGLAGDDEALESHGVGRGPGR